LDVDIMLTMIDLADTLAAAELLAFQRRAYQSEADLINYPALSPLRESLPELLDSGETVLGWRVDGELIGAIGYTASMVEVTISRLAVATEYRRRGIAAKLVQAVIYEAGPRPVVASTAKANVPGVTLYEHLGFHLRDETATPDGLALVQMQRLAERTLNLKH
jgi:ribosomal protein S18 acetylase RimI-like enzyme